MSENPEAAASTLLNANCFCTTLDRVLLTRALDAEVGLPGFAERLGLAQPTLFSNVPVFVPAAALAAMARIAMAVEAAARLPGYQAAALLHAPPMAGLDFGPLGVLMGYDFHLTPDGPRLIEINTNAGGAFLNAVLARAQRACCARGRAPFEAASDDSFGRAVIGMFANEWRLQGKQVAPRLIAIVDDAPEEQRLYPEFQLAKALLESRGVSATIADPGALQFTSNGLSVSGRSIDLIYNRLVDFSLEEPRHATLRDAYLKGAVVLTPNPRNHALLADKRNLELLSRSDELRSWGLSDDHLAALSTGMLRTVLVSAENADALWVDRRHLFFKPAKGHASKGAYRGDKLTQGAWADILGGVYVAQAQAPPSARGVVVGQDRVALKTDIRLYTYDGAPLLAAARLYQGQTTNMRTPGGGFAPVLEV